MAVPPRLPMALVLGIALAAAGCAGVVDQGASLITGSRPLKTAPSPPPGVEWGCMEALLEGTLAGDPADPALVWVESGGQRTDLTWPHGFTVRFSPGAEVLAPDGRVVAREGEPVSFGGGFITDTFEICTIDGVVQGAPAR